MKQQELKELLNNMKKMLYSGQNALDTYNHALSKGLTKYESVCMLDIAKSEIH